MNRIHILAVAIIVLVAAGVYQLDIKPKRDQRAELAAQISTDKAALSAANADVAAGEQARADRRATAARVVRIGRAVPDDLDQPSLVYQLNAAAHASGIAFVAVTLGGDGSPAGGTATSGTTLPPGAVAGVNGSAAQPLELEFRGTYFELERFLRRIRGFVTVGDREIRVRGRLVVAQAIALEPAEDGFPAITAKVKATTYLQPEAAGAATPGAGAASGAAAAPGAAAPGAAATPGPTTAPGAAAAPVTSGVTDR